MADDGEFRIAGAFTEIYLKDSTDADWAKIKAKLEKDKGVTIKVGLDQTSAKQTGVDLRATAKAIGDNSPVSLKVDVDKTSLAKAAEEIKAANAQAAEAGSAASSGGGIGKMGALIAGGGILAGAVGGAALLGGIATGISAIGIAAVAENKQVKASFADLTNEAKQVGTEGFAPLVPVVRGFASQAEAAVTGLEPKVRQAALTIAPQLDVIGTGLVSSVTKGVDDVVPVLSRLDPLATSVGRSFGTMEQGVSQALNGIDATKAATSVDSLSTSAKEVVGPLGGVLNAAEPLGTGLVNVLARGLGTTEQEMSELTPVTNALGGGLNALAPVAGFLAPPILAAGVASKLLTGSWTDLSGAGQKLISPITDLNGTLTGLANKVGFTTAAQNASTKADLEAAAQKALLNKELAEEAVADAVLSDAHGNETRATLELAAAEDALAVASAEAVAAEDAAAAAAEGLTFAMGPIGLVLGVVAVAAGAFALKGKDASSTAQDLSQQIIQLGNSAPGAAANLASGSSDLQKYATSLTAVGSSSQEFAQKYSGSIQSATQYTNRLSTAQGTLGNTMVKLDANTALLVNKGDDLQAVQLEQGISVRDLNDKIKDGKVSMDGLSTSVTGQISRFRDYNRIVPQAKNALTDMTAAQHAQTAALAQEGIAVSSSQSAWNAFGNGVAQTVSDFNTATAGIKSLTDATVNADSTFFQDQASFAQLDAAVTQAAQAKSQAAAGIVSAEHGITQASQGVSSALHSEQQATEAVTTARAGVIASERAVTAAQTTYTQSLAAERTAQAALSAARKQAVIDLQNLQRQVTDQGDTEAEAQVRLLDATNAVIDAGLSGKTLASIGPLNTGNEANFQLLLAEQEAQHNLNNVTAQGQQLAAQNAAQQKAGVAGAAGVVSATQAVTQAQQQDKASAQALADSKAAVAKSSAAVREAQYQERQAHLATENAVSAERQAQGQLTTAKAAAQAAVVALKVAKDADSRSTDINTAAGAANFTKIEQLFEANRDAGLSVSEATVATIAQGKSMHITAGNVKEVIDKVTGLNGSTARFGVVGVPSVDMSDLINAAARQGLNPRQLGFTSKQIGNARASGSGIFPTHAEGGPIGGEGTGTSDSNLIWASKDEHMWTADEVKAAGGHRAMYAMRKAVKGYAGGGPIGGDGASILGANLMLAEVGGMFEAARKTYRQIGVTDLPDLAVKNPPTPTVTGNAAAGSGLRGSRAANEALMQRIWASMFGWTGAQWADTVPLIMQESGFNNTAQNPTSTAYGQFQFLDCVPLTAEILTQDGWKTWDTVQVGDKTLGYNQASGQSEWTPILAKVVKPPQRVVRMSVGNWSARVTPGHRWMSERRTTAPVAEHAALRCPVCSATRSKRGPFTSSRAVQTHLGRAHGLVRDDPGIHRVQEFVRTDEITQAHRLRVSAEVQDGDGNDQLSDAEVALLGWIVGDGHINHASRTVNVWIYQSKKRFLPVIDALLDGIPHGRYVRDRQPGKLLPAVAWRLSSPYARDLLDRSRLLDGTPDEFVLSLSTKQRQVWLDAVWQAEGWNVQSGQNGVVRRFSQNAGRWADAMTLAAYLCGYRPTRHLSKRTNPKHGDNWTVTMGRPWIGGTEIAFEEAGDQAVWCVNTELGTWTMRQGGLPMLTGNSTWASYGIPKTSDSEQQDIAGGRYIKDRYINPAGALAHERAYNWYDHGGYMLKSPGINTTGKPEMTLDPGMTETLDTINAAVQSPSRTTSTGRSVNITQYITQQPQEDGVVFAARTNAQTSWAAMISVGG